jgi:CheY-like chemotaxis protein
MFIEDDKIANFVHERLFKRLNICDSILFFLNGASALRHLEEELNLGKESPGLIFLDIHMPVMNGFEFLEVYQHMKFSNGKNVEIIALTNSNHERDLEQLKALNCRHILNKPLTEEALRTLFPEIVLSAQSN